MREVVGAGAGVLHAPFDFQLFMSKTLFSPAERAKLNVQTTGIWGMSGETSRALGQ
jgi:hypothetical protein